MLSVIICSRTPFLSPKLKENINATIGCEYELIMIDNSQNKYSIFEAYNLGIVKSSGVYWCFMHDDIIIHTINWGIIIKEIFCANLQVGLVGIAGGKIKTMMPSAWWEANKNVLKLLQHNEDGSQENWDQGFEGQDDIEVAAIDGVFMVMRSSEHIFFNESLKGFHNYDLYLSLQQHIFGNKVLVTNRIFIEHFSQGHLDIKWLKSTHVFHKKYKKQLPIYHKDIFSKEYIKKLEYKVGAKFVEKLIENNMFKEAVYWWFEILKIHPYSKYHYRFWKSIFKKIICLQS